MSKIALTRETFQICNFFLPREPREIFPSLCGSSFYRWFSPLQFISAAVGFSGRWKSYQECLVWNVLGWSFFYWSLVYQLATWASTPFLLFLSPFLTRERDMTLSLDLLFLLPPTRNHCKNRPGKSSQKNFCAKPGKWVPRGFSRKCKSTFLSASGSERRKKNIGARQNFDWWKVRKESLDDEIIRNFLDSSSEFGVVAFSNWTEDGGF